MRTNKCVRGIVIKEGKVLLIKRIKNGSKYWVVPGGGVEDSEGLEEALRREMREETGLDILSFELLRVDKEFEKIQHIYLCEMSEGIPTLGGPEATDQNENNQYILTWVPIKEVESLESLYPNFVKQVVNDR